MKKKILIVGTVPYNEKSTSRAFESYFSKWDKRSIAQIFSNTKAPVKGHCSTLFQITDQRLIYRRFKSKIETGKIFNYNDLSECWVDNSLELDSNLFSKLYKIGTKKNPSIYLIRKFVWRKKYWCSNLLNEWLDEFQPECVFLSFSDDFFIQEIALYVANRYNIPIISSIGDDYYFNYNFSLSIFYHIYKLKYRKQVRSIFNYSKRAIFIGDKIKEKYNSEFGLKGETVYLSSAIERREYKPINPNKISISYFGNIRLGRNHSLNEIGCALGKINRDYVLSIYSNEVDEKYYRLFASNPNIKFHGSIPYQEVINITKNSDIVVVVEGFRKKDVEITRYSLSTKVADSLKSGANVFAYGSIECGAIEYAEKTQSMIVCTDKNNLLTKLTNLINDPYLQEKLYLSAKKISEEVHSIEVSTSVFESVLINTLKETIDESN